MCNHVVFMLDGSVDGDRGIIHVNRMSLDGFVDGVSRDNRCAIILYLC